jgi:hypothetical protein
MFIWRCNEEANNGFPTPFRSPDLLGELPHEVVSAPTLQLARI